MIRRSEDWVFGPSASYELTGDVPNVVFSCGVVVDRETGQLRLYYGAADTRIGVATANVSEVLDWLRRSNQPTTGQRAGDQGLIHVIPAVS